MIRFLLALLGSGCLAVNANAQSDPGPGFNINANCIQTIERMTDLERVILGAWVTGYVDRLQDNQSTLLRLDNALTVTNNMERACQARPEVSFVEMLQFQTRGGQDAPGSRPHAEAMLNQFLNADTNRRVALTAALKPTEADIRAVYAAPMADRLMEMYANMFSTDAQIGPNEGQTEVRTWMATTAQLREGGPALREFPGGYEDVREFLIGDHPIVRFVFVKPGETRGMAFDGLIYVNDRWVLMPKPWGALPE